jgi:hypothetical protein
MTTARRFTLPPSHPREPYYWPDGEGGLGLPQRKDIRRTLLASTSTSETLGSFELDGEAGANLLQISCQQPCRLLLYATEQDRTDDLDREEGDYPLSPCLLDIRFGDGGDTPAEFRLFDQGEEGIYLLNRDDPARTTIYFRVVPDTDFIVDGYLIKSFGGGFGPTEILADDGMTAAAGFGLNYIAQADTNPFNRFDDDTGTPSGGWDNYWVTWRGGPPGLRARSGDTNPIARYWSDVPLAQSEYAMVTYFQWAPMAPLIDSGWYHGHVYFCNSSSSFYSKNGTLQVNFTKHAIHEGQVSITWTDSGGTSHSLATDSTDYDVTAPRLMESRIIDNTITVTIDGAFSCSATIPSDLMTSKQRGLGLILTAQTVPDATRNYAGLAVYAWNVQLGHTFPIVLDLGYVPLEAPGGSLRTASGKPPLTSFSV